MRQIKFLGDTGLPIVLEAPNSLTVADFIAALVEKGGQFNLEKNILVERKTRATYLTSDSIIPDGDISLFSTVKDPKGNLSRIECYQFIKNSGNVEFFNKEKNYTNKSTVELERLISVFNEGETIQEEEQGEATELYLDYIEDGSYFFSDDDGNKYFISQNALADNIIEEDSEFLDLKAAQDSFAPRLTRRNN